MRRQAAGEGIKLRTSNDWVQLNDDDDAAVFAPYTHRMQSATMSEESSFADESIVKNIDGRRTMKNKQPITSPYIQSYTHKNTHN